VADFGSLRSSWTGDDPVRCGRNLYMSGCFGQHVLSVSYLLFLSLPFACAFQPFVHIIECHFVMYTSAVNFESGLDRSSDVNRHAS
jgi:hypothetical protein